LAILPQTLANLLRGELGHAVVVGGVEAALESGAARATATISGREPTPLRRIDGSVAGAARLLIEKRHPTIFRGQHRIRADGVLDCSLRVAAVEAWPWYCVYRVLAGTPSRSHDLVNLIDLFDWR
jgi:hypothetical protein